MAGSHCLDVGCLGSPAQPAECRTIFLGICDFLAGQEAGGRLQALAECYAALETCLQLLGLWAEQPQDVLLELRQLALKR